MPGDQILGGSKGLPPVELSFFTWITDATTAATATSPDNTATLIDAVATKKSKDSGGSVLDIVARFRVGDTMTTTITASTSDDKSNFKTSGPTDSGSAGTSAPIDNPTKLANSPWNIWASYTKIKNYSSFKFYRPSTSALVANKKLIDQPYYEFFDDKKKSLGLFGATDGKEYPK